MISIVKTKVFWCLLLAVTAVNGNAVYGQVGDMSYFGGISEGERLPKTTEILLEEESGNGKGEKGEPMVYKEVIFLAGEPMVYEGMLTVKSEEIGAESVGEYKETHIVQDAKTTDEDISLNRNISFDVKYRRQGNQIIRDYEVSKWVETVITPEAEYEVDPENSYLNISIIQDNSSGVAYYKGNISGNTTYISKSEGGEDDGSEESKDAVSNVSGVFYAYDCPWSSTQTHRLEYVLSKGGRQMQYMVCPSVTVAKTLEYSQNEPQPISFPGNYMEIMENTSVLEYRILTKPKELYMVQDYGQVDIASFNSFEQLIAPDTNFIKGNIAQTDIEKLFAMGILDGKPEFYLPSQSMTRGEYVTALAKALRLPIEKTDETAKKGKNVEVIDIVFPDVTPDRQQYPYIMAAYKAGVIVGRENSNFFIDSPIDRQEAVVMLVRALGLNNTTLNPSYMTAFTDDYDIEDWARDDIHTAHSLGILLPDSQGLCRPDEPLSKGEGARIINGLVEYMRKGLVEDYRDRLIG